jgi:hypothetical protein
MGPGAELVAHQQFVAAVAFEGFLFELGAVEIALQADPGVAVGATSWSGSK